MRIIRIVPSVVALSLLILALLSLALAGDNKQAASTLAAPGDVYLRVVSCFEDLSVRLNSLAEDTIEPGPGEEALRELIALQETATQKAGRKLRDALPGLLSRHRVALEKFEANIAESFILDECDAVVRFIDTSETKTKIEQAQDKGKKGKEAYDSVKKLIKDFIEKIGDSLLLPDWLKDLLEILNELVKMFL